MTNLQQSNIVARGEAWFMQQSYVDGTYMLQKHVPNMQRKKIAQLHYEFELIQKLQLQMMLQPETIVQDEQYTTMHYIVKEPYIPLTQLLGKPIQVTAFLKLAIQMTNCFIELHQVSHIYQNFHPQHIFINKLNNTIKFINFEQTFKYSHHQYHLQHEQNIPLHRVLYMAPEETGRVNSVVDMQTDLYALGAIFYEMLTGRPIYEGKSDAVIYQLLTKKPKSFKQLGIDVPIAIENIIFKLLSKDKEQRYKSAIGLKEDLSTCWYHLTNNIPLNAFPLARHDEQGKWQLKLINPITKKLMQELVSNIGQGQKVQIVSGPKYSGKTFLLQQLDIYYTNLNGSSYLLCSNNDGESLNIPVIFLSIRKKLQQYIQSNQAELLNKRSGWPTYIPSSIVYFLPELRTITSELKFSEDQEYIEQYQLFQIIFQIIDYLNIQSVESIFLVDDYDALDSFTQQFLEFARTQYSHNRFVLTAINEEMLAPILVDVEFVSLQLQLLSKEQIFEWLAESLKDDKEAIEQCAALLYDVSNGIPLYIETFFNNFCELQILKYNILETTWYFDVSKIHALDLTNYNVFINDSLNSLNGKQLDIITHAVGLGVRFDVIQLLEIAPYEYAETLRLFIQLVEKRIFIILPEQFSMIELLVDLDMLQEFDIFAQFFNIDMLKQVKSRISNEQLVMIHMKIVENLAHKKLATSEQKRRLWHHLNIIEQNLSEEQRLLYLQISLELGNLTLKNAVFHEALNFGIVFEQIMPEEYWQTHYQLALQGFILYANALYLNDKLEKAMPLFELILTKAQSIEDKLFVYNETILFLTFSQVELPVISRLKYIANLTKEALALVHIKMPEKNFSYHIAKEYLKLKRTLHKKSNEELLNMPKITNKQIHLVLQILMNSTGILMILDEKLYVWGILKGLRLHQQYGDQVYACFFYGSYSNILSIAFKDYENSYRFGKLSIEHLEAYDNLLFKGNIYMNFGGSVSFLKDPYDRAIYYLTKTQQHSIPNTLHDLYNSTAAAYILVSMHLKSVPLTNFKQEYEEQRPFLLATNNPLAHIYTRELLHWVEVLQLETSRIDWDMPVSNKTRVSYWESHLILRLQMSYLLCEEEIGERLITEIEKTIEQAPVRPELPHYYFYKALTLYRLLERTENISKRTSMLKQIGKCIKVLKKFTEIGPINHEHLLTLIEAMKYRYSRHEDKAKLYFDRAIQLARHNENGRDEAIAQLNAALFYYDNDEKQKAAQYMQRSMELFYRWGAPYVVTVMSAKFRHLLQLEQMIAEEESVKPFNVAPIVNLYQHIAQDEQVEHLAKAALTEMMTQMDATQIHLIKVNVDEFYPIASVNSEDDSFHYYDKKTVYLPASIDVNILQEVIASKSYIVRNDVSDEHKSVIALAVFTKGQVTAIVYAVNYVMSSIFTKSKIDIVTILATQFLVALENYERQHELEMIVQKRTEELSEVNAQLQEMNAQLIQSEQERKYFLQHISHDLRSPLTSVLGYVEALQSGLVTSEEKKLQYLQRSKMRLISLQHLIKDLFDMTQLESGHLQFNFQQISVEQLAISIEELMESVLSSDMLTHTCEVFIPEETLFVNVDIERILQVFQNFASNILKYANEGNVVVHFIVVEDKLTITVADQGIGIPYKDIPFVFDMHYVGSNHSRKESYGIGMAICKRIIDLHEGTIEVASTVGRGTTFTIELPIIT